MELPLSIIHVGLAVSSEASARSIFAELFGFRELYRFKLERDHAWSLMRIDSTADVMVYDAGHSKLEVFIPSRPLEPAITFNHVCLAVDDVEETVRKAELLGLEIRRISKESRMVTFIIDCDGNLYEIKPGG